MTRRSTSIGLAVAAFAVATTGAGDTAAAATAERCGSAVAAASNRILRTDSRALGRCALAILEQAPSGEITELCGRLRTPGLRLDRLDDRSRTRIARRCSEELPPWMPARCAGPGPFTGTGQTDGQSVAECVVMSAHCAALASLDIVFDDAVGTLGAQSPENLGYPFGGDPRNTFLACLGDTPATTTTIGTPTTTVPETTTTLSPGSTTTLAAPTTTSTSTTLPVGGALDLVITEIMSNPAAQSDAAGEYFEVLNTGTSTVDLAGLEIHDLGSDAFTVADPLVVAPGARVVFAKSNTAAGGRVDYVYGSGMNLTNSSDEIVLTSPSGVVDEVVYDGAFPAATGRAIELVVAASASANDAPGAWCVSDSPLGDGDFGTPGDAPGACVP